MFIILVQFKIHEEHKDAFQEAVLKQAENSLNNEDDCHTFDVSVDPEDSCSFLLYEAYTNREAFDHHVTTPHFKQFNETVGEWIAEKQLTPWNRLT